MFITVEILKQHKACEQGIKYIERFYPNGAEMIDIIRDRHINKEFLHWGRENLIVGEEDQKAYAKACNITNSEGYWYSVNVHNSKYVANSKNVHESTSVFGSEDITKGKDIVSSDNIEASTQIFYSSMVDDSQKIYRSTNITESVNICNSTMVARSKSVIDSFNVFDSSEIMNCVSVSDSHFCRNCKNIKFCMFCDELENAEYCIFNIPIEKSHYEMILKQYNKYLTELLGFIHEWPEELSTSVHKSPTKKFDDWFYPISEKFWKWARTLPGYDMMILYRITLLSDILIEKI